jgi:hypothetical protein
VTEAFRDCCNDLGTDWRSVGISSSLRDTNDDLDCGSDIDLDLSTGFAVEPLRDCNGVDISSADERRDNDLDLISTNDVDLRNDDSDFESFKSTVDGLRDCNGDFFTFVDDRRE